MSKEDFETTYIGLDVLVLEVERVLPNVNTDNRDVGCRQHGTSIWHSAVHPVLWDATSSIGRLCLTVTPKRALTQQRVLVGSRRHLQLLCSLVPSEPSPSGPLDSSGLGVDLGLEVVEAAKVGLDLVVEGARSWGFGLLGAGGREVLPEELGVSGCTLLRIKKGDKRILNGWHERHRERLIPLISFHGKPLAALKGGRVPL